MGIAEREMGKPFYIATGSYKSVRLFLLKQLDLTKMGPETGLIFMDTAILEVTGVVVGTRPLLHDYILLCEVRGWKIGAEWSNYTTII